jgi:cation-transporting ATPase E
VAAGRTNAVEVRTSRTIGEIVRSNVFTVFNGLLAALFVCILLTGRWQNGLFGLVIVANSAIGIFQEVRAKRTLDRLAVLNAPRARVVRDGSVTEVEVGDVVADDLLELRSGDQVLADGVVHKSDGLEIDESLLTGESDPVAKEPDDDVRSGSIVVAGQGRFQATAVGADAYATKLAAEARRFTLAHSELRAGTNTLLRWISLIMLVVGPFLLWSQFRTKDNETWQDAVTGTVEAGERRSGIGLVHIAHRRPRNIAIGAVDAAGRSIDLPLHLCVFMNGRAAFRRDLCERNLAVPLRIGHQEAFEAVKP